MNGLTGRRWVLATGLCLLIALAATAPTVADFGLTYDEPAYRHSQMLSIQWWQRLARGPDRAALLTPDALLYYWDYGRFGINFHPPLAGQLNLLSYAFFGDILQDIPARRMASVIEFSLVATLLFGFLARRSGVWVGAVAAGSLLLLPRLYGQSHLIDTDTLGLLIWAAIACAGWKGLNEPRSGFWRATTGILVGLAFVEKLGAVLAILPLLGWIFLTRFGRGGRAAWVDGIVTSVVLMLPSAVALVEIRRLGFALLALQSRLGIPLPDLSPSRTDLFRDHPETWLPGGILLLPLAFWCVRRGLNRALRASPVWGRERPALEIWAAILAFGPAVAWLGNPTWWREALPRLAHYYAITTTRRGVLPDIQILYFGQGYEYSLPWPNAFVLLAITVPASILIAAILGLILAPWRGRLPLYFLVNLITLPVMRIFPTPAHDGVRLFLPTFFFLAAFAGWGTIELAARVGNRFARPLLAALVLVPATWGLVRIHPYELSYYNEFIGGPRGAWHRGFELSYWYDAFTDEVVVEATRRLPAGSAVEFANEKSNPVMIPETQQSLGAIRADIHFGADAHDLAHPHFPFIWLLTHDSKADAFSRLLFAMTPWYASAPRQLGGARVATVAGPIAASRAWALQLLLDQADTAPPAPPLAPEWVRLQVPWLARLWGDGVTRTTPLRINDNLLGWARDDPEGLRAAARAIAQNVAPDTPAAARLRAILRRYPKRFKLLLQSRPEALPEAVEIVLRHPEELRRILLRQGYTDVGTTYLDADLAP